MLDLDALLADDELPEVAVPGKSQKYLASSGETERYTPEWITTLCAQALKGIDLDPAAPINLARRTVPAKRFLTEIEDGLTTPWAFPNSPPPTVFLNPPYGHGIGLWVARLAAYRDEGLIGPSIALLPVRTDAKWFQYAWAADLMCFWYGRIKFLDENGVPMPQPNFAPLVCYYGPESGQARFIEVLGMRGKLIHPR